MAEPHATTPTGPAQDLLGSCVVKPRHGVYLNRERVVSSASESVRVLAVGRPGVTGRRLNTAHTSRVRLGPIHQ